MNVRMNVPVVHGFPWRETKQEHSFPRSMSYDGHQKTVLTKTGASLKKSAPDVARMVFRGPDRSQYLRTVCSRIGSVEASDNLFSLDVLSAGPQKRPCISVPNFRRIPSAPALSARQRPLHVCVLVISSE